MVRAAAHPFGIKQVVRRRPVWSPWQLGSALIAWWSAEDLPNGAVAAWRSRTGGFNPTQATGANQPTRSVTAFNGYPGVTFDGTSDYLELVGTTGLPTGATEGEVWAVASAVSSAVQANVLSYGGTGAGSHRSITKTNTNLTRITDGNRTLDGTTAIVPQIIGAFFGPPIAPPNNRINGRKNGVAFGPSDPYTLATGTLRLRIGATTATSPANFYNGVISEAMIINGLLAAADRERIEGDLAWRYGLAGSLPDTHPYKSERPFI